MTSLSLTSIATNSHLIQGEELGMRSITMFEGRANSIDQLTNVLRQELLAS